MIEAQNIEHEAQHSFDRTLPHVEGILGLSIKKRLPWLETIRLTVAEDFYLYSHASPSRRPNIMF